MPNTNSQLKWAVKVPLSVNKKATYRNRNRRIIDEAIKNQAYKKTQRGINMLVLVKKDLHLKNRDEIKGLVTEILMQLQQL